MVSSACAAACGRTPNTAFAMRSGAAAAQRAAHPAKAAPRASWGSAEAPWEVAMAATMHWPALITLLTLVLLAACAWYVSLARGKYKVRAPATTGPEEFERAYRVQMNTLENTVIFLPALWLAALYFSPRIAALLGAVWLVARVWYAFAYARDRRSRGAPFTLAGAAWTVLMVLAIFGLLTSPLW
jgi:glutathione S-transferase